MVAPAEVIELIERFEVHREAYRSSHYKEAQLREEFINPFFKALGWDVYNEHGYAEAYKDVVHEDAVKVSGVTKAPDYCFRTGGTRKFFVEAKKPSVHIDDDTGSAYQLRRYAWSAKLPLSILTDFDEFVVYDCLRKPSHTDKASVGRVMLLNYKDYTRRWDEIASIFSREAILKGSFDKYAESSKSKRGTAAVDDAFLEEIEVWRASLAQNIYRHNPHLRTRELNAAVQATINRTVFLRICEARGIEPYGLLLSLTNGPHVYERLGQLFRSADDRYNSGLFHFHQEKGISEPPDEWTLSLTIDDKLLKDILRNLYYPESPYEFSVLPADILGQVYERFLGKVIRLMPRHQVVVEDKPEVKKAGGVFYTPTYIVDYIVKNTVGKLLEGKTSKQVAGLKVADIACGSGSFLIAAYQYLLDWYRDAYIGEGPQKHKKELYQAAGGNWSLTPGERKRILLAHIYGVDIDAQAVEVTKLSLLLKVLEGESGETLATQLQFFRERALPDLGNNIKCGNSLIGPEFYDEERQMSLIDEEERYRINVFDWQAEFPEVFRGPGSGFDAIIGNPPYIRIQTLKEWMPLEVEYYKRTYVAAAKGNYDVYVVFVERGLSMLNRQGRLGFILPNKFLATDYGRSLRGLLTEAGVVDAVVDFGHDQVFQTATTYTCLLFLNRSRPASINYFQARAGGTLDVVAPERVSPAELGDGPWVLVKNDAHNLLRKLEDRGVPLLDLPARMSRGSSTGADQVFCVNESDGRLVSRDGAPVDLEWGVLRRPIFATDFTRFHFRPKNQDRIVFPYEVSESGESLLSELAFRDEWPEAYRYLCARRGELERRKQGTKWYGYSAPRNLHIHDKASFLVPLLADRGLCSPMPENATDYCVMASAGFSVSIDTPMVHPTYVLGLVNSRVLFWMLRQISNKFRGGWITCTKQYFGRLPIYIPDMTKPGDKARYDQMVSLVEQMLAMHKQLAAAMTAHDKAVLQRQIDALDKRIDALVYRLYELTDEEVQVVEEATQAHSDASSDSAGGKVDSRDGALTSAS